MSVSRIGLNHIALRKTCPSSHNGKFTIQYLNPTKAAPMQTPYQDAILTLQNGTIKDSENNTGYIDSAQIWRFNDTVPSDAIYDSGWSICQPHNTLSVATSSVFHHCSADNVNHISISSNNPNCVPQHITTVHAIEAEPPPIKRTHQNAFNATGSTGFNTSLPTTSSTSTTPTDQTTYTNAPYQNSSTDSSSNLSTAVTIATSIITPIAFIVGLGLYLWFNHRRKARAIPRIIAPPRPFYEKPEPGDTQPPAHLDELQEADATGVNGRAELGAWESGWELEGSKPRTGELDDKDIPMKELHDKEGQARKQDGSVLGEGGGTSVAGSMRSGSRRGKDDDEIQYEALRTAKE